MPSLGNTCVLSSVTPDGVVELAQFTRRGDEVTAEYRTEATRRMIERGIWVRDRLLRPSDGGAFFESLEQAFANSSTLRVRFA